MQTKKEIKYRTEIIFFTVIHPNSLTNSQSRR